MTQQIVGQARVRDLYLHFQARGEAVNRPYGLALDFLLPEDFDTDAVDSAADVAELESLAGTDPLYVPATLFIEDGKLVIEVAGQRIARALGE